MWCKYSCRSKRNDDRTEEAYGKLDVAFNNAEIMIPVTFIDEISEKLYDQVMNIDLKGVWLYLKYKIQQMRKQGGGVIVNNSSIGGD